MNLADELKMISDKANGIINESKKTLKESKEMEELFSKYVPSSGEADTVGGEIVRAFNKIDYRWYNDGDVYFAGYGIETCGNAACYLIDKGFDILEKIPEEVYYDPYRKGPSDADSKKYEGYLEELENQILDYLNSHQELFQQENTEDCLDDRDPEGAFEDYCFTDVDYDSDEINELGLHDDLYYLLQDMFRGATLDNPYRGTISHVKMDDVEDLEREINAMVEQAYEEQNEEEEEEEDEEDY